MNPGWIIVPVLTLAACMTPPTIAQRPVQWNYSLESVGFIPMDDHTKNQLARAFTSRLVRETNSSLVTSVTASSPGGYDFSATVRAFFDRAAVPYTSGEANLIADYVIRSVDGPIKGPDFRNYEMSLSIIRPDSLLGGDQVMAMRNVRYRCRRDAPQTSASSCAAMGTEIAEALLYELAAGYKN